jgi:hypothetical protein
MIDSGMNDLRFARVSRIAKTALRHRRRNDDEVAAIKFLFHAPDQSGRQHRAAVSRPDPEPVAFLQNDPLPGARMHRRILDKGDRVPSTRGAQACKTEPVPAMEHIAACDMARQKTVCVHGGKNNREVPRAIAPRQLKTSSSVVYPVVNPAEIS